MKLAVSTLIFASLGLGRVGFAGQHFAPAGESKRSINDSRAISSPSKPIWSPNFEVLADSIKKHENSAKFHYGVERRVNGVLRGYPEPVARQKCIAICREQYAVWLKTGGDYFRVLGKRYAQDPNWAESVKRIYDKQFKRN